MEINLIAERRLQRRIRDAAGITPPYLAFHLVIFFMPDGSSIAGVLKTRD